MITSRTPQHLLRHPLPTVDVPRSVNTVEHHAVLSARLTERDRWVLAMLHEHRVLTSNQLRDAAFASDRVTRLRLRELYLWGAVSRFRPFQPLGSAPMHYVLGPAGAAVLAAIHGLTVKELGYSHHRAMSIAHNQRLAHTRGVADFFTSLIARTRHQPNGRQVDRDVVVAWWSEARCGRHFGDLVIPDAYGRWRTGTGELEFFLEYDTGTESLTKVSRKLAAYHRLADSTGIATPVLLWFPTARRETGARLALAPAHSGLDRPDSVPVATAAADLLDPHAAHPSPADPVWLPLTAHRRHLRRRASLSGLAEAWPQLSPTDTTVSADDQVATAVADVAAVRRLPAPDPTPPAPTRNRRTQL